MRKVILMMSISLDGFLEGPHRELDLQLVDDDVLERKAQPGAVPALSLAKPGVPRHADRDE